MEKASSGKLDISTILINLLALAFLCYVSWLLSAKGAMLRVVAVYALMMPRIISLFRAFRRTSKITDLEQWIFVGIALVLWIIQSILTGKLHRVFF